MSNVYENLGVRPIINAYAPMTRLGGGVMAQEVADAMREATQFCVDIAELQMGASKIIAEITGAEAGCVTSGAAAASAGGNRSLRRRHGSGEDEQAARHQGHEERSDRHAQPAQFL